MLHLPWHPFQGLSASKVQGVRPLKFLDWISVELESLKFLIKANNYLSKDCEGMHKL